MILNEVVSSRKLLQMLVPHLRYSRILWDSAVSSSFEMPVEDCDVLEERKLDRSR